MESFTCGFRECEKSSVFVCNRCQTEFYCSKKCQVKAFQTHRFNCFELPSLSLISVGISSDNLPNDLNKEFKKKQVLVNQIAESTITDVEIETSGSSVASSKEVNQDQANNKTDEVATFVQKQTPVKPIRKPMKFPITVNNSENMQNGMKLNGFKENTEDKKPEPPKNPRRYLKDLKQKPFPRLKFTANLLSGNIEERSFSIVEEVNQPMIASIQEEIDKMVENNNLGETHVPEKDEVVLSKFEGKFYRGLCKEVKTDGFLIYYLDYGNTDTVQQQDIHKIPENLLAFDVFVHQCFIENFPLKMNQKVAEILGSEQITIIDARKDVVGESYIARIVGL